MQALTDGSERSSGPDVTHHEEARAFPQLELGQSHGVGELLRRIVQNPHCHRPARLRLAPHLAYVERLFPADHVSTPAPGRVSSLSDLRNAVRRPALNEPACVARPLLVHCDRLRVGDLTEQEAKTGSADLQVGGSQVRMVVSHDWPHLLHLDAAQQVQAENQWGRHDAPSAKVGAAPLESPASGHLAELQHVPVRQSEPEREQQTDTEVKWRAFSSRICPAALRGERLLAVQEPPRGLQTVPRSGANM